MIRADELSAEVRNIRVRRAGGDTSTEPIPFADLPEADRQAWEDTAEAIRNLTSSERIPNVPASVREEQALRLVRLARESIELALALAPNWNESKLLVEDIQALEQMRRQLLALEIDT